MSDSEGEPGVPKQPNKEEDPGSGGEKEKEEVEEEKPEEKRGGIKSKLNGMFAGGMPGMGMPGMMGGANPLLLKKQKEKEEKKKKAREEQEALEKAARGEDSDASEKGDKAKEEDKKAEENPKSAPKKSAPKLAASAPKKKEKEVSGPKAPPAKKKGEKAEPKAPPGKKNKEEQSKRDSEFSSKLESAITRKDSAQVRTLVEQVDSISDSAMQTKLAEKAFAFLSGQQEEEDDDESDEEKEDKEEKKERKNKPQAPRPASPSSRKLPRAPKKAKKAPRKDYGEEEKLPPLNEMPPDQQLRHVKHTMNVVKREYSEHFLPSHEDEDTFIRELDSVVEGRATRWERPTHKATDARERIYFSGFLRKEGGAIKSWKQRFFVVYASRIDYFEKKDGKPKGSIDLSGKCQLDPTKKRQGVKYPCIELAFMNRRWHIAGETMEDNRRFYAVVALRVLDAQYQRSVGKNKVCKGLVRFMQRELTDKPVPLYLNDQPLDAAAIQVLCQLISRGTTQQISALELRNAGLDSSSAAKVLGAVAARKKKTMTRIDLSDNPIFLPGSGDGKERKTSPAECMRELFFNSELHPLQHIILENCGIGGKLLKEVAASYQPSDSRSKFTTLFLNNNKIGNSGLTALGKLVGKQCLHRTLQSLSLSGCNVGDTGCEVLATWIDNTASLRDLLLSNNKITEEGVKVLCKPLELDTCLKRLDLSCNDGIDKAGEAAKVLSYTAQRNTSLSQLKFANVVLGAPALTAMRILCEYGIAPLEARH